MEFGESKLLKYATENVFIHSSKPLNGTGNASRYDQIVQAAYPGIHDSELTSLTSVQRNVFVTIVSVLCVLSICGNLSTLYVNMRRRRKIRPFFRACLISLAFSDLVNTIFWSTAYLGQYRSEYVQIWSLGGALCRSIPFATTTAILASSMTLIGIGLDRYFAVMKSVIGCWNPSVFFCVACIMVIWGASILLACPVLYIYAVASVYIVSDTKSGEFYTSEEDSPIVVVPEDDIVHICISDQHDVTLYYVIIFGIIFIPCIFAFIWLNSIIAKKLWIRRHSVSRMRKRSKGLFRRTSKRSSNNIKLLEQKNNKDSQNCSCEIPHTPTINMPRSGLRPVEDQTVPTKSPPNSSREARHIRMFTLILLMVAVFIFFRLPAWIFQLMRMYGNYTRPAHWLIYFSFGILNLASCVLNPLFYTFLTQTIRCALFMKVKLWDGVCGLRLCCVEPQQLDSQRVFCCIATFCACFSVANASAEPQEVARGNLELSWSSKGVLELGEQVVNNDKDEGVECDGDDSEDDDDEENADDFHEFNQRIYTIFPSSLVSSSMTS